MAITVSGSASIAGEVRISYIKELLYRAQDILLFNKSGFVRNWDIAPGEGKTAQWRRFENLPPATTPLTEGITPAPSQMTMSKITVDADQYGSWIPFSDIVTKVSIDPLLMECAAELGYQAGLTIDTIAANAYKTTTNVLYATGTTNDSIGAGDIMTDIIAKKAVRTLEFNKARKYGNPMTGMYYAICHTYVKMDILAMNAYLYPGYYQDKKPLETGALPDTYGITWNVTNLAPVVVNAGVINCYYSFVFGPQAIGSVNLKNMDLDMIFKGLGYGDDPLNQRQSSGWKTTYAARVLNSAFILKVVTAATQ